MAFNRSALEKGLACINMWQYKEEGIFLCHNEFLSCDAHDLGQYGKAIAQN